MWVVEALDKTEEGALGLSRCWEAVAVQQLTLLRGKEAPTQGFVEPVPNRFHGRADASSATTLAKGKGGVLSAPVRMMDHALWTSPPRSHLQRIEHQLSPQVSKAPPWRLKASSSTAR